MTINTNLDDHKGFQVVSAILGLVFLHVGLQMKKQQTNCKIFSNDYKMANHGLDLSEYLKLLNLEQLNELAKNDNN